MEDSEDFTIPIAYYQFYKAWADFISQPPPEESLEISNFINLRYPNKNKNKKPSSEEKRLFESIDDHLRKQKFDRVCKLFSKRSPRSNLDRCLTENFVDECAYQEECEDTGTLAPSFYEDYLRLIIK